MILSPDDPFLVEALLDPRFTRRYLAEGDSWFSLGGWTGNLLMALDDEQTLIVNCASPGDTLDDMGRGLFSRALARADGVAPWTAVLLSGGGNDLLANCAEFIVPDPAGPIDYDAMLGTLAWVEREIERLLILCRAGQPGVPVFMHSYDHPPVSRRWWFWQLGPWVSPVLRAACIDRARWDGLAAMMIDNLVERLVAVAQRWDGVTLVDTRGCLLASDWQNEIHPKTIGYHELARPWRRALNH